jgi:hypothetical protein
VTLGLWPSVLLSVLNEIRNLINIEEKIIQSNFNNSVNQSGVVWSLSSSAQGLDYTNRIGDSIKLQRIQIMAKFVMNTASTGTALRFILIRDLWQQGAGTPSVADLLGTSVGTPFAPLQPKIWLTRDRYAVIQDELIALAQSGDDCIAMNIDIPHEGHVKYVGTTSGPTSNGPGSLYIILVSDENTNVPVASACCRITYTDD